MKNYLLKVENVLLIPNHTFQDNLTQYQGSNGHSATSDVHCLCLQKPGVQAGTVPCTGIEG
jgi:hypothetical protein